tara:strand:- start:30468 stop:31943 length:1476 start_codon:yes stop_codon:yes gene_type:complete
MKKCIGLFVIFFLVTNLLPAQNFLKTFSDKEEPVQHRWQAGSDLIDSLYDAQELDSALKISYSLDSKLFQKLEPIHQAKWIEQRGDVYFELYEFDSALHYFLIGLEHYKTINDSTIPAAIINKIGQAYEDKGFYAKAHEYYIEALKRAELGIDTLNITVSLYSIGSIYEIQGDLDKAIDYFNQSLVISAIAKDTMGLAAVNNSMGLVQEELGNVDSAIYYYSESMKVYERMNDLEGKSGVNNNLGILYDNEGNFELALQYYQKSLDDAVILDDPIGQIGSLVNIGYVYYEMEDYPQALDYCNKALVLKDDVDYLEYSTTLYQYLYLIHKETGNFELALEMHEIYMDQEDSLFSMDSQRQLVEQESKFEFEKAAFIEQQEKEKLQQAQESQKERRNTLQYYGISLGLFVLFGLLFLASKFKLPKWLVAFATFLPILILFEFLLVLLDGYIEQWSGGLPAYKLLFNVALAGLIFPIHAFMEALFKKRLFGKNK